MADMLNTGLAIVAIATLAGLGLMRGTITSLRESLSDARAEIADKDRRLGENDRKLAELEARVAVLTSTVTGEVHWVALEQQVDDHHKTAMTQWADIRDVLRDIHVLLGEIRDINKGA